MNSDAAGASNPPPPPPQPRQSPAQTPSNSEPTYQQHQQHAASSSYPPAFAGRPPQPPPLHPLHTSPDRTSSYGSVQSPYQYNSASTLSAQSQQGQSPHFHPYASSRDPYPAGYGHQQHPQTAGVLASPYTPQPMSAGVQHPEQQSYFTHAHQRSHSIQSVPNPYPPPPPNSYSFHSRDSPLSGPSQPFPPSTQRSLPGTPVRPPVAPYPLHSPLSARPQSSGHDSQPAQRSIPWTAQDHVQDQRNMMSPNAQPQHSRHNSQQVDPAARHYSGSTQRERSESVSPKTILPPGYRQESTGAVDQQEAPQWNHSGDQRPKESPPGPTSGVGHGAQKPHPSPAAPVNSTPTKMDTPGSRTGSSPHPPQRKRMRYDEPPIYARRARTKGKPPMIPNRRPPIPKHMRQSEQGSWHPRERSSSANVPSVAPAPPTPKNQAEDGPRSNGRPIAQQPPEPPQVGTLGPWEPSITGFIPHEEITKIVCDFLFRHVVLRNDVAAGPAGSAAPGQGAIIEIEGKLGQLIDLDRGDRLLLPVLTESIINKDNPRFRTSFESSMTLVRIPLLYFVQPI